MNDIERAILSIFREFDVAGGQMLMFPSFVSRLDGYGVTMQQFHEGMDSLIQKCLVEQKNQGPPGAFFLTAAGFQVSLNA